ncbi:MAG: cation-translocating P-type ATPase [Candidatus Improbicoccus pseudotrichonymphae]|uniref:Cation-translocating P-type ATPase n=1 Tax=Candidatus Improbicoccus pseudotrichonymphae TaxID=3033792 RepID=A0AA48HVB9_9FIRM|nr:MAG: cation-translocating P-type ATPase [Candidatus Improbicoccus pseudotrichonymphae]
MKNYYSMSFDDLSKVFDTGVNGISNKEAEVRLRKYGFNDYEPPPKERIIGRIFKQFRDISMIVLLVAACISLIMALRDGSGFIEPIVIFGIMIMNMSLTIIQERNAEKAIDELSELNTPNCIVLRENSRVVLSKSQLVPGDIIYLQSGDLVPADARLIECTQFEVDESSITGESESCEKSSEVIFNENIPISEQKNMVFSNCHVTKGKATAVVISTGMKTQIGKIASMLNQSKKEITPLQKKLNRVVNFVSMISVAFSAIMFLFGLIRGENIWNMFLTMILLSVAATPETLSLIVTLSLTRGVKNIVKIHGLVRNLHAVETLGSVSVICSDKTGTLTQNRMEVKKIWIEDDEIFGSNDKFNEKRSEFVRKLAMASNVDLNLENNTVANPTEMAILKLFFNVKEKIEDVYLKVHEVPFTSERKMMSVVFRNNKENNFLILTKGALDKMSFEEANTKKIENVHDDFTKNEALRVLALGSKIVEKFDPSSSDFNNSFLETGLKFEGMVGIFDPPKNDVKISVETARKAGIKVIMITGDHVNTASAVAREIGILDGVTNVISGEELKNMSDEELYRNIEKYSVYARVLPEDKYRIVQAWQKHNHVVSMTGDGINDAPALKLSDVGVAMGIAGSEVSKNASDLILTDDNFSTIIQSVREGRNIYSSIQKTVCFLITCCCTEIIIMIVPQILNWGILMSPIMLLLIDLLVTGLPSLFFAREVSEENIMLNKPIDKNSSILSRVFLSKLLVQVVLTSISVILSFYIGRFISVSQSVYPDLKVAQTMSFLTLGISSVLNIFVIVSKSGILNHNWHTNPKLVITSFFTMFVLVIMVLFSNLGGVVLGSVSISFAHWVAVFCLSFVPLFLGEIIKTRLAGVAQ